ncbi:hypothetical protein [uncultured Psychrobacillus sp.]|uniref:hypothetical protein n=1 Tax=uncultured Psychrobacillus sp. TaxID=1551585 RepID=UPI00260FF541|nr:hypothetical protein [uncultured Psychrobacillus sp.]
MEGDLYSPSLSGEQIEETKSYNLSSLFIVAALGQLVAISALGLQNAIWLKVKRKVLYTLLSIISVLFLLKFSLIYAYTHQMIDIERSTYRLMGSVMAIVCFAAVYNLLKGSFNLHVSTKGDTKSLVVPGTIWCITSVAVEMILIITISII